MFEFFDPATGIFTALIAAGLRLVEAFWRQCNKRSKREYKLRRARQESDADTLRHGMGRVTNMRISTDEYDYAISDPSEEDSDEDSAIGK